MKRDIDLIREILECVEESDRILATVRIEGRDRAQVLHHIELCLEAKFLKRKPNSKSGISADTAVSLTWQGYNALEKLRNGGGITSIADCTP